MRSYTLISAIAGASIALASVVPAPAPQITAPPLLPREALLRRQVEEGADSTSYSSYTGTYTNKKAECRASSSSLAWDSPANSYLAGDNNELASWYLTAWQSPEVTTLAAMQIDERCTMLYEKITPPASLASSYSALQSAESSWASQNSAVVMSMADFCGIAWNFEGMLITDVDSCKTMVSSYLSYASSWMPNAWPTTATTETTATAAVAATTSSSTAGAARETGMVAAAAVAAMAFVGGMDGW
ncbi:hypothetical protein QBC42DRAFT_280752 [Cladorrhinum samala]|uniref:Infection structure specific protein n=1 Tax=Cladorrhinum samala TaxID=585594 RepID=A0AAV9H9W8_9PEZI|nr:hypothetical protein QBC42DRAFT_280752 [Cladorrhinum samala]